MRIYVSFLLHTKRQFGRTYNAVSTMRHECANLKATEEHHDCGLRQNEQAERDGQANEPNILIDQWLPRMTSPVNIGIKFERICSVMVQYVDANAQGAVKFYSSFSSSAMLQFPDSSHKHGASYGIADTGWDGARTDVRRRIQLPRTACKTPKSQAYPRSREGPLPAYSYHASEP